MPSQYYAVIDPRGPGHREWRDVFGADFVEVESRRPETVRSPCGEPVDAFMVKVSSLTDLQLGRCIRNFALKARVSLYEAAAEILGAHGMPIRANAVRICKDPLAGRLFFDRSEA